MIEIDIADRAWTAVLPDAEALAQVAAAAAAPSGAGVAILLTDDGRQAELNARFRDKVGSTNVLSFPAGPGAGDHLGDLSLAFGTCEREAREQGKPFAHHLQHLVVHGVLHLLGHDHMVDDEAGAMEALERRVLAGIGVSDPYAAAWGDHA